MTDEVWNPPLDDSDLDSLSARLRAPVRDVLPKLLGAGRRDDTEHRPGRVEIEPAPGLRLGLAVTQMRRVTLADRPVLEAWLQGTVHSLDRGTGRPLEMPVSGTCRIDLATGAVVHLDL